MQTMTRRRDSPTPFSSPANTSRSAAQMLTDIDRTWGRDALTCIMRLPPEQLALAHATVAAKVGGDMLRLDAEAVRQAGHLARTAVARGGIRTASRPAGLPRLAAGSRRSFNSSAPGHRRLAGARR